MTATQKNARELKNLFNLIINSALQNSNDHMVGSKTLEAIIIACCGKDPRTVKRHLYLLDVFGYVQPIIRVGEKTASAYKIMRHPKLEKTLDFFEVEIGVKL